METREQTIDVIVENLANKHKRWYFSGPRRLVEMVVDAFLEVEDIAKPFHVLEAEVARLKREKAEHICYPHYEDMGK